MWRTGACVVSQEIFNLMCFDSLYVLGKNTGWLVKVIPRYHTKPSNNTNTDYKIIPLWNNFDKIKDYWKSFPFQYSPEDDLRSQKP